MTARHLTQMRVPVEPRRRTDYQVHDSPDPGSTITDSDRVEDAVL
jgi:hypothetical protein